jgi:hypothetical protein
MSKHTVVIAGNSNGEGEAFWEDLTGGRGAILSQPFASVQLWDRADIRQPHSIDYDLGPYTLRPRPFSKPTKTNMGLELSMGRWLASVDSHDLIKLDIPGASLAVEWLPTGTYPQANPNMVQILIARMQAAAVQFGGPISGLVLMLGEADALNSAPANAFQANGQSFVDTIRVPFPNLPILIVKINSGNPAPFVATVQAAQQAIVNANPHMALVNADDLVTTLHYNADQLDTLGTRCAQYMINLEGLISPMTSLFYTSQDSLSLQVTDASTDPNPLVGGIVSWDLDWGDGTAHSTGPGPWNHTYALGNTYNVTLTVTSVDGRIAASTQPMTVTIATWVVDSSSRKGCPATIAEWNSVLAANPLTVGKSPPDTLLQCQDLAGPIRDNSGNAIDFTTPVVGILFAQAVAGWTRLGWQTHDGTHERAVSISTLLPNLAVDNMMVLLYGLLRSTPGSLRSIIEGPSTIRGQVNSQPHLRIASTVGTKDPRGAVRPYTFDVNRVGTGLFELSDDQEILSIPIPTGVTGKKLVIGGDGSLSPALSNLYCAVWFAAHAGWTRAERKAMHQTLGWMIPW